MAALVSVFDTGGYDAWKEMFDADPAGRTSAAQGHRIMRSLADPDRVFVRVDFDSADVAETFRDRLMSSGVLDRITVVVEPTVVDIADDVTY